MGMAEWETPPTTVPLVFLRNIMASLLLHAVRSFLFFAQKYKLLETFRGAFLFFLRFVPSPILDCVLVPPLTPDKYDTTAQRNDSGIGRALSQLLSIMNDIPVCSRKYEVVRSLAERVIDENHRDGTHALRRVNCEVLSAAFSTTLSRLEAAAAAGGRDGESGGPVEHPLGRVLQMVRDIVGPSVMRGRGEASRNGISAVKLAAELLWLAQKLAACGCGQEAVLRWATASNLGRLALSAEPRLQASLVKLAAFLFREAKDMDLNETEESKMVPHMQVKLKMLLSWLPLLCRASNGTDAPILSISERSELERVLEETIEGIEQEEEQERVLSMWLHHFTHCPSSDWPNLHACYARWCSASRKQLLLQ
ncbi:uncharacterized protein LOC133308113 [Gastrolobium bilobum]|uniref:uncharacterized protein LOC133308113 n=1 Tax=Gastrolobium bilobum TaxID=150636 RepID=UPI002AB0E1C1|nr:uncharacterized protein LOC133308113 [Gastrolobium bilobum]